MIRFRKFFPLSFRAKVLLPVIAVMVLLVIIMAAVINDRITQQFESDAKRTLQIANAGFRELQHSRTKNLLARFRDLRNEPRYRETLRSLDPAKIRGKLEGLLAETDTDLSIAMFSGEQGLVASAKLDPLISIANFEAASADIIGDAMKSDDIVDTIHVDGHFYDIVSMPVYDVKKTVIGVLTLGSEIGREVAAEFSRATHSEIVLLADGRVALSTLPAAESNIGLIELFRELAGGTTPADTSLKIRKQVFGGQHYFYTANRFAFLSNESDLGYLLFCSYEQPWQDLQRTQQILLGISAVVILFGSVVICFLVGKVTQPLRELRDSAEAVGRGDFSRRVQVRYNDECGELARVFNQMTENLKSSRDQVESTVTTLRATQAQLIQSEKLSGIGEFIAGVAHELNNPLTSVMGFSELLQQAEVAPKWKRYLDMMNKSALRCQKIVQALLSFARHRSPERKLASINELIGSSIDILQYQLRTSNIQIIPRLDERVPQTMVDAHQLQQVFVNLLSNARQAIEAHQPKGWIKVRTESNGARIRIIFQDNGPGIAKENLSKIFDPFFTTKGVGEGTGLGLSLCYGIIQEHDGTIIPVSRPGEGAMFIIELPVTAETTDTSEERRLAEVESANDHEGEGKRILVIDDEEPILHMLRETLEPRGYEVDVAADGESGLRQLKGKKYDLMLCDWKMPGLNGQQVYERVLSTNPRFCDRIIFITGDVVSEKTRTFLEQQNKVCLAKPFTLPEFHAAIRKVLEPTEREPANRLGLS